MITTEEIHERVGRCVAEVLAIEPSKVTPQSKLMPELGADSLDLVELMYLVEDEFDISLDAQDMSLTAQLGLSEEEVHEDEVLTSRALELLRARFPEAGELLVQGAVRRDLAALITPAEIGRTVRRKLAEKDAGEDEE